MSGALSMLDRSSLSGLPTAAAVLAQRGLGPGGRGRIPGEDDFGSVLERATSLDHGTKKEDRAQGAAEDFVSVVFVDPILKQAREMNHAAPPFAPSTGEKQFGALLDARIARQITKAAHFPIVDRLARDLQRAGRGAS